MNKDEMFEFALQAVKEQIPGTFVEINEQNPIPLLFTQSWTANQAQIILPAEEVNFVRKLYYLDEVNISALSNAGSALAGTCLIDFQTIVGGSIILGLSAGANLRLCGIVCSSVTYAANGATGGNVTFTTKGIQFVAAVPES